ncbi:MAG TPA: hypothetical protein VLB83_00955 [Candidatus Paceibacterota bacterium]|nr:hypothetical protein [Candidatus Paceibacterota bacterium]
MGKYLISDIMPAGRKGKKSAGDDHEAHAAHKKAPEHASAHKAAAHPAAHHEKHAAVSHHASPAHHPRAKSAEPHAEAVETPPVTATPPTPNIEPAETQRSAITQDGVMYTHAAEGVATPNVEPIGAYPYNVPEIPESSPLTHSAPAHAEYTDDDADIIEDDQGSHRGEIFDRASSQDAAPKKPDMGTDRTFDMDSVSQYPYSGGASSSSYGDHGGRKLPALRSFAPFAIGVAILIVTVLVGGEFFARATVTVQPKTYAIVIDQKLSAAKEPNSDALGFSVMAVDLEESMQVPATGSKTVTAKASGKIVIYNNYSTKPQRLIKNTRFQSPAGKIYRISESVNIPGQTTEGGKTVPGSVEVTVYADEAGPEFNSDLTDFTIPGLKGDPRFDAMYARSKTPITGGASGTVSTVSDEDLKRAKDDLRIALETKLRMKARGDIAESQIAFDSGIFVELDPYKVDASAESKDTARVVQTGTIYVILFDRAALTRELAKRQVPGYVGEAVDIENLDAITFRPETKTGKEAWEAKEISFALNGPVRFSWTIDEAKLTTELAGAPRSAFNAMMEAYPNVDQAEAVIKPKWKRSFPDDAEKITIELLEPEIAITTPAPLPTETETTEAAPQE